MATNGATPQPPATLPANFNFNTPNPAPVASTNGGTPPATLPANFNFKTGQSPTPPQTLPANFNFSSPKPQTLNPVQTDVQNAVVGAGKSAIASGEATWNDGSHENLNPMDMVQGAASGFMSAIDNVKQTFKSYVTSQVPTTFSGKVAQDAGVLGSLVNVPLQTISGAFKGAESLPVIGVAAKGINTLFSAVGAGSSDLAMTAWQNMPYVSQETKDNLAPIVQNVASLAGQIVLGKAGADTISQFHDGVQKILTGIRDNTDVKTPLTEAAGIKEPVSQETSPETAEKPPITTQESVKQAPASTEPVEGEKAPVASETAEKTAPKFTTDATGSKVIPTTGKTVDVRTAKSAADVAQKMADKGFEALPEEEKAKYSPKTVAEQKAKVADLMANKMDDARAMIRGDKKVPTDMSGQVLFNSMEKYADLHNDADLYSDLAKSPLASKLSAGMSEASLHGHTDNPYSAVDAIREVTQAREADYLKRTGETAEKAKRATVEKDRTSLNTELKGAISKRPTWEQLVESITCKA